MGIIAARNILSSIDAIAEEEEISHLEDYPEIKPRMAISVGDDAVEYTEESSVVRTGPDVLQHFFGHDMGLKGTSFILTEMCEGVIILIDRKSVDCWTRLGLSVKD